MPMKTTSVAKAVIENTEIGTELNAVDQTKKMEEKPYG
jgi:hypothetical protein